jgi:poly(A) polymerase
MIKKDKMLNVAPHITEIVAELQDSGYEAYIVGGAIRDLMLDRTPKDYDLSTAATPDQIKDVFGRRRARIIGKRFRLVHLYQGRDIIEISTFRTTPQNTKRLQEKIKDNNLPEKMILHDNEFGTAKEDAWRRDFTVNALFYNPLRHQIIDFTGTGVQDIYHGIVRSIGDPMVRFEEDPVRLLRALKLVGQYNFKLDPAIADALQRSLPLIEHAAESRLTLELEKILTGGYGEKILTAFHEYGFLKYYLPFLDEVWDTPPAQYMLELLGERNHRILSQKYRGSLSLAVALITLPFVESGLGNGEKGSLWEKRQVDIAEIDNVIRKVFAPHHLIKNVSHIANRIIALQPVLAGSKHKMERLCESNGYGHAREIFLIQNALVWHSQELAEKWPPESHQHSFGPRKGRFRDPRRKHTTAPPVTEQN